MGKFDRHQPKGNIAKDNQKTRKIAKLNGTAKSLAASTIGSGGVLVSDGANITVLDGGNVSIEDGGSLWVLYPSNVPALYMGRTVGGDTGLDTGFGLLVQMDGDESNIFEATQHISGVGFVSAGEFGSPISGFYAFAEEIVLDAQAGGGSTYITHDTTSAAIPMCIIETSGQIRRSTSGAKYKQDIEDADATALANAVLRLRPRKWRDRGEVERDPETTRRYIGVIAEEAAEDGLADLVSYDPESGDAEAFGYPQLTVPLAALCQRQQREIDGLRSDVDDLKAVLAAALARIDALEAQ